MEAKNYSEEIFENLKHINEYGQEFWYARELQPALEYSQWRRFADAIERAKIACEKSGHKVADHFAGAGKMVNVGSGAKRIVDDFALSRYACYLIVMNGDPRKEIIALGQTYFAVKTRQQELIEDYERLSEEQKGEAPNWQLIFSALPRLKKSSVENIFRERLRPTKRILKLERKFVRPLQNWAVPCQKIYLRQTKVYGSLKKNTNKKYLQRLMRTNI